MPKVKVVDTLYSMSINRITSILISSYNLISVNVERSIQHTTDSDIKSANNPFHSIPTTLLEAIISSISINTTTTKPFNIEFLITAELTKLIFPRSYCFKLYLNIFPKLEKLRVLVLENSIADNRSLQLIGKWCKNLRILDLHECSRLSDIGIEWLLEYSSPELRKNLQLLAITQSDITKKGAKMAIQHFPAIKCVKHKQSFDVLIEVARAAELFAQHLAHQHPSHITGTYSLTRIVIYISSTYRSGDIELMIKYFPSLSDLTFLVKKGLTDTDLSCLTNLKNLQILKFFTDPNSDEDEISITFDRGLAPVFKVIGSTIINLELDHFEFVDIWTLVKFCPNLIALNFENQCQNLSALSENEIIQLRNEKGRGIFKDLKFLGCGFNISKDILFDLLSCPSLESVQLTHCDALTEEFLKEAISYDLFNKNLICLKLNSCEFVTKEVLDELAMSDNNLEEISIYFCDKVTKDHVKDWHTFARHQNWELYLSFEDDDTELISYY